MKAATELAQRLPDLATDAESYRILSEAAAELVRLQRENERLEETIKRRNPHYERFENLEKMEARAKAVAQDDSLDYGVVEGARFILEG